jgi:hypothetical protein
MRLIGDLKSVDSLSRAQKQRMFELLQMYFEGADADIFHKDLQEKQWVILLLDSRDSSIQGFSTQMLLECVVNQQLIKALFSGDTIINRSHWGEHELAKQWLRLAEQLISLYPQDRLYWFLISKGYKTYRFLPVYFKNFYPCYNKETPKFEKQIMDTLGYLKYPNNYCISDGVIHFSQETAYLKKGVADIDEKRLRDPHIRFFIEHNPLYSKGDELVCLAEISYDNFNPCVFKMQPVASKL